MRLTPNQAESLICKGTDFDTDKRFTLNFDTNIKGLRKSTLKACRAYLHPLTDYSSLAHVLSTVQKDAPYEWTEFVSDVMQAMEAHDAGLVSFHSDEDDDAPIS